MKYNYFISYLVQIKGDSGVIPGNNFYLMDSKIETPEDIIEIQNTIGKIIDDENISSIVIINFILV